MVSLLRHNALASWHLAGLVSTNMCRQLDVNNHVLRRLDGRECKMFALMEEEAQKQQRTERYMISTRMEHGQVRAPVCVAICENVFGTV